MLKRLRTALEYCSKSIKSNHWIMDNVNTELFIQIQKTRNRWALLF